MNKGLLLLVALMALVAFSSARPLMFYADQTDAPLGLAFAWAGVTFAYTTTMKGTNPHRVRFFGVAHVNETLTDAWIGDKNGTIIQHLAVSTNSSNPYILADYRMNDSVWSLMTHEELWVTIATANHPNGSVTGYFRCRPYQGISFLDAFQVVGANSTSNAAGLGWASIDIPTIFSLPQDILSQDLSIETSASFSGRVIHGADNATAIGFFGPANASETGALLATASLYNAPTNDGRWSNVTITPDFLDIAYDLTYFQVTALAGDIRGQVYALLTPSRRQIPYAVDTVNGVTTVPAAGFSTLRYANQEGNEHNSNSYVTCMATANPNNFTYLAVYTFKSATNKKNRDLDRAITVEMNALITGTGTWLFEIFDATLGEFLPMGTLSDSDTSSWTPAFIDNFSFDTPQYANNRTQMIIRVSVDSGVDTSLLLDLFGIRSWTPSSTTNQGVRFIVKIISKSEPGMFANGTIIN